VPKKKINKYSVYSKEMTKIAQKNSILKLEWGSLDFCQEKIQIILKKKLAKYILLLLFFERIFCKEIKIKPQKRREKTMTMLELLTNWKKT